MLFDIVRFNTFATDILLPPNSEEPMEPTGVFANSFVLTTFS